MTGFFKRMLGIRDFVPDRWTESFPWAPASPADVVAMTVWGEARGETEEGRKAVASVIFNRAMWGNRRLFMRGASSDETATHPGRMRAVCLARKQFSCWAGGRFTQERPYVCPQWLHCVDLGTASTTGGTAGWASSTDALYYHSTRIARPSWAAGMTPVLALGGHIFYR